MIWENIRNLIGTGIGVGAGAGFPRTLKISDFISAGVAVYADKWNTVGEVTISAQQKVKIGYGSPNQPANQGYVYVYLKTNAGVEVKGKVRFTYADAQKFKKETVLDEEEEVLHGSTSDRNLMKPLPEKHNPIRADGKAWQDDRILMEIYPESSVTISNTTSIVFLPVTQF